MPPQQHACREQHACIPTPRTDTHRGRTRAHIELDTHMLCAHMGNHTPWADVGTGSAMHAHTLCAHISLWECLWAALHAHAHAMCTHALLCKHGHTQNTACLRSYQCANTLVHTHYATCIHTSVCTHEHTLRQVHAHTYCRTTTPHCVHYEHARTHTWLHAHAHTSTHPQVVHLHDCAPQLHTPPPHTAPWPPPAPHNA